MLLQKGDAGVDVEKLQLRLLELGYACGAGIADGLYGNGTYNSVSDFQRLNSLRVDGIAGPNTLTVLYSASPNRYEVGYMDSYNQNSNQVKVLLEKFINIALANRGVQCLCHGALNKRDYWYLPETEMVSYLNLRQCL